MLGIIVREFMTQLSPGTSCRQVLKETVRLRYHRTEYVRVLAAQAVGFLLRQAPKQALRAAVRVLMRQHAVNPTPERTQVDCLINQSCTYLFVSGGGI